MLFLRLPTLTALVLWEGMPGSTEVVDACPMGLCLSKVSPGEAGPDVITGVVYRWSGVRVFPTNT